MTPGPDHSPEDVPLTFDRRKFLIGAVAGSLGLAAVSYGLGQSHALDALMPGSDYSPQPLSPEAGEDESSLDIAWLPKTVSRWQSDIEQAAKLNQLDPNVLAIIMLVESAGDPRVVSPAGATGLMQITAARAHDIASRFMTPPRTHYDLRDPATNVEFGAANIRHLIAEFGDPDQGPSWDHTVQLVAASYNGGEGAAADLQSGGLRALRGETYAYVRYVSNMWRERHDNKSFTLYYWQYVAGGNALLARAATYHP